MPDFKYYFDELALQLSGVKNYTENALRAVREMFHQTGILKCDKEGIGRRGLLIRHLILPGQLENSTTVLDILAKNGLNKAYLSLMSQYFPAYKACDSVVNRRISREEYQTVKHHARLLGFSRGWFQDM
jgi:putative pyruvate formate lyase activating enzyme